MAVTPEADERPWRLFVAIELPDALRQALRDPLSGLEPLKDWFRPSPVEQIHLTLHFLGAVDPARVPRITAVLLPAVGSQAAFDLHVRGVGAFGGLKHPRVLWAAFDEEGVDGLRALRAETAGALKQADFDTDTDFRPHLTLGRMRRPIDRSGREPLDHWVSTWKDRDFGTLPVRSVHLVRSQLGGGPARHSGVARFELQ